MAFLFAMALLLFSATVALLSPEWRESDPIFVIALAAIGASVAFSLVASARKRFEFKFLGEPKPLRDWATVVGLYYAGVVLGIAAGGLESSSQVLIILIGNFAVANFIFFMFDFMAKLLSARVRGAR